MAAYSAGRGGYREGSGRKKGSVAVKHRVVVEDPKGLMPVEWMLAVLRDPEAEPARRDAMANMAAPYLHPRLNAVNINGEVKGGGGDTTINNNTVNIFAVPRGATLDLKDGKVSVDNGPTTLEPVEPFTGTPALTDQTDTNQQTNKSEPLPVQEVDTSNVTRLDRAFERALQSVASRRPPPDSDDRP